jgi:CRISPR-associated protein Csx10
VLDVCLTAHQPLALGVRPSGRAPTQTQLHVPGSVLRGALAGAWIRDHGEPSKERGELRREFVALFESDTLFGPLFVEGTGVVPLSVRRCKYQACPGVHPDAAFADEVPASCPSCQGPLTPGRGEVESFGSAHQALAVETTHLEIEDHTQVAREGMLFTRRALRHKDATGSERILRGRITPGAELPSSAAHWLGQQHDLRLGGRRSTNGGVTYTARAATPQPPRTGPLVAIRLLAPAILADASGLPLDLTDRASLWDALNEELYGVLGVRISGVKRVWSRREYIGGWHAASNLPKPVELAASAGTVILLAFERPPAPDALLALALRGLGLRRNEGFGSLEVATCAWSPPAGPPPAPTCEEPVDLPTTYAERLAETEHSKWLVDQLRPFLQELNNGGSRAGYVDVLNRPRLRDLTKAQRDDLEALLISAPVDVLDRTLQRLDALCRLKGKGEST